MRNPIPGAEVIERPVAKTSAEAGSDEFYVRCIRADNAQYAANQRVLGRQARPGATASPPPARPAPVDHEAAGATAARDMLGMAGGAPQGSASRDADADQPTGQDAAFLAGAETARALLGHSAPSPRSAAAPAAPAASNPSAEYEAGAAEARQLLGQ